MKARTVFVAVLVLGALLLMMGLAGARSGELAAAAGPPALSGGVYRLVSTCAAAESVAQGGGYRLVSAAPAEFAGGCCCTYLPLIVRNW
jgi:hypothetical protein